MKTILFILFILIPYAVRTLESQKDLRESISKDHEIFTMDFSGGHLIVYVDEKSKIHSDCFTKDGTYTSIISIRDEGVNYDDIKRFSLCIEDPEARKRYVNHMQNLADQLRL